MQLPSIDKTQRNPVKPSGEQVRKIQHSEQIHPRDYAIEMDKVLEREQRKPQQQSREFGEDTFEHTEESEQQSSEHDTETEPDQQDTTPDSNDDQNIDIKI